ncbi:MULTISPECIES: hypothetical protein [Acinetobacter]|uniref:hypothetical protein n=1 Tax=Acinetobacter TaxID=469 RepID=UPI0004F517D4|nr:MULTISPECIES: hypothetical protein [Acinetobacter]MBF6679611.1 hypothetical protein [Acinetobacter baumannii]MBF6900188.1 hypothetical protein [Acinetobacter baumannii]MDE9409828.1 hypothetical protein [Acinetobacter nosocomialis]RSB94380.1 hypothetical protein EGS33_09520 [Acinetobacter sp. FDAARGOS_541]WJI01156.1 hypothetical protein MW889_01645 [Acinetobacter nosocomialis]
MNNLKNRKVSIPLAIGIFIAPIFFAWFTLRQGYTKTARIISFGYLALAFLAFFALPKQPQKVEHPTVQTESKQTVPVKTEAEMTVEADAKAKQLKQQFEDRKAELEEEDKPHFEWPKVDYTQPVAKVDLKNDQAIIKAVGKPIADQEKLTNENGEPATTYYFSKTNASGLEVTLSREFIDVAWQFNDKEPEKAAEFFNDGQRITRALLGGKEGAALYENIAKGGKVDFLSLDDGIEIHNARCGAYMCRYQVVR